MRCVIPLFLLAPVLEGCGPSAGAGDGAGSGVTYGSLTATRATLQSTWGGQSAIAPASLPASGTASYDGILSLDAQTASGVLAMAGSFSATAHFASDGLSGKAQGFKDETGATMSGVLNLSNGFIDRGANPATDPGLYADLTGTLSGHGDSFDITAGLTGDFLGAGGGAITGTINGTAQSNFGLGFITGSVIAEQ